MIELRKSLEDYLAIRSSLGFELRLAGAALHNFISFLEYARAPFITRDLALRWATQPKDVQPSQWANRLGMVRRFAQYRSAEDPRTEIPPQGLLPHRYHRKPPYIYSDDEITLLIEAAKQLSSTIGLRPYTYSTLFGLLAVTGMRMSEPIGLNREEVDLSRGVLTIRRGKFGKSRLIPIHSTTMNVLRHYACLRDQIFPKPKTSSFLVSDHGTRLTDCTVRWTFVKLSHRIGLRSPSDRRGPRLHDLRHRFAIKTLLSWYRNSIDVEQHIPELATYLGHVHVADTYWYLQAIPELLRLAAMRMEGEEGLS